MLILDCILGTVQHTNNGFTAMLNVDECKSYATEANLLKALTKLGLDKCRPVIVCNRKGRFTAIFGLNISGMAGTGNVMFAAHHGFMTIN